MDGVFPRNTVLEEIEKGDEDEEDATHVIVFLPLAKSTNLNLVYTAIERIAPSNWCMGVLGDLLPFLYSSYCIRNVQVRNCR